MALELEVQQTNINTVSVKIDALVIGKKQMTISVFKQLENGSLIDYDSGEFTGLPWGRVNYCSNGASCWGGHTHVVWQDGSKLKQDCVSHSFDRNWEKSELEKSLVKSCAPHIKHFMILNYYKGLSANKIDCGTNKLNLRGVSFDIDFGWTEARLLESGNKELLAKSEEWLKEKGFEDFEMLKSFLRCEIDNYKLTLINTDNILEKIKLRINEVKQLPQLFIAV